MSRPSMSNRSSEVERIIAAAEVDTTFAGKKAIRYRGRRSTWPGALGLFVIFAGTIAGLVYYGIQEHEAVNDVLASDAAIRQRWGYGTVIDDGRPVGNVTEDIDVVNPEEYVDRKCEQPNYISKNGKIYASFTGGKEVQLNIKGVNWLGMEVSAGVPKGLWDNSREGSTLYRVGQFLSNNKFNAVRLPLSIDAALRNTEITTNLVNTNSNRALAGATRYRSFLGLIVQGLGTFNMSVVLDFHVLSALSKDADGLWYGTSIQLNDIKEAITNLAMDLCNSKYYNIMGIDLKDGLSKTATWGDGSNTDWAAAATTLGNHVVKECPKWLAFVQGVEGSSHKDKYDGDREIKSKFFAGSDLSGVKDSPIKLDTSNKLVYAPKYWTSSYLPMAYFFDSGEPKGDMLEDYVESSNDTLKKNVDLNMNYMFGPALESGAAVVLSSFGGLLGTEDKTKSKTSTRIVEILIEKMLASEKGLAGGFWWTFNPETSWPYPAPDNSNSTQSGLVDKAYREANQNVLKNLKGMDKMPGVNFLPCITA
ncbi:hypothetical protein Poli38472_014666 [Pythium oligandrum]|uniref:Glycoside hydrolase family 5 domain-containing protein n=1 Tax=Pythium oligandrum TaxID=41045 RepID=A0A8K1FIL8_PYTOL|nr:hypothetical protein Poli38472_014666 [Pythium oligandrum]|eukprot:TMW63961.1 hypothetical protein Poli38472_014666 [Pythium oligandrum]